MVLLRHCSRSGAYAPRALQFARPVQQRRTITQDVQITRTGKPIISVAGGRSSLGGHTVTVFGATGFLGRFIVNRLARSGNTVVIPYREEMTKRHLKVGGDLGRVVFLEWDIYNTQSIEESVRHSDIVYNLTGRDYPTKNYSLKDVHVEGAERIAEAVAKYDIDRFVHVSSYNADPEHPCEFFRTKGEGEQVVRKIFPETTIVRPSLCFGEGDRLLQRLAGVTNTITSNHMKERFNPVHAIDVGRALETMCWDDTTASQTYELYGPTTYSMKELSEVVDKEILKERRHINIPKRVMKPLAKLMNDYIWWKTTSADEVEREFYDQYIDPNALTFKDLGIEPVDVKDMLFEYVRDWRDFSHYSLPPMTEKEKREDRKYLHVINSH